MVSKTYYVYILSSKRNGTLYVGVTNNLQRRIYEHKNNLAKGFTQKYNIHNLVYYEETNDINVAIGREKQIIDERIKKIEELRAQGVNPYAYKFEEKRDNSEDLKKEYEKLKNEKYGKKTIVAGRIMAKRSMGKISFLKLQDFKGNIQIVLQKDETPDKTIELSKKLDSGDIIGISGKVFRTKSGELSIMAENIETWPESNF